MAHWCLQCNKGLSGYNRGKLCFACQEKQLEEQFADREGLIDVEDYAFILGLDNPESVKRLARQGKLADRLPAIRKYLWRKEDIDVWIKNEGRWGNKNF